MYYQGGKKRVGAAIADVIRTLERERFGADAKPRPYYEPFCGMLGVATHMAQPDRALYASDAHPYVAALWTAWRDGWRPPADVVVSPDEYRRLREVQARAAEPTPWLAFVGFAYSHSGVWFRGYGEADAERRRDKSTAAMERTWRRLEQNAGGERAVRRQLRLRCADYRTALDGVRNSIIYMDPPYAGTAGYYMPTCAVDGRARKCQTRVLPFDHAAFWGYVRRLSAPARNNLVLVSEYEAPADFRSVWRKQLVCPIHNEHNHESSQRVEQLFVYQAGDGGGEQAAPEQTGHDK